MTLLGALSYVGAIAAAVSLTFALASALLWLAELIEEHAQSAKTFGTRLLYGIIALHVALWTVDGLPGHIMLFSIACHLVYLQNFSASWPIVSLTSPSFLASGALVLADHFWWFVYFSKRAQDARHRARGYRGNRGGLPIDEHIPTFGEIATFFGVCVWLIPIFLFLSLSANDNALPTSSGSASTPSQTTVPKIQTPNNRGSLLKSLFDLIPGSPFRLGRGSRQHDEGIIAPRTPRTPTFSFSSNPNSRPSSPMLPPSSPRLGEVPSITLSKPPPPPRRSFTVDAASLSSRQAFAMRSKDSLKED